MRTNMKKLLAVLFITVSALALSACGKKAEVLDMDADMLGQYANTVLSFQASIPAEELGNLTGLDAEDLAMQVGLSEDSFITPDVLLSSMQSWELALDELGELQNLDEGTITATSKDAVTYTVVATGAKKTANIEFVFDKRARITSVSANINYTFLEKMERAALNTLLGMGTVFVVLILISFIIGWFRYIPKLEASFKAKKQKNQPVSAVQSIEQTVTQIAKKEEELTEDLELIAVISAAIAAAEGTSADGFVVRSIRKVNKKWHNA